MYFFSLLRTLILDFCKLVNNFECKISNQDTAYDSNHDNAEHFKRQIVP